MVEQTGEELELINRKAALLKVLANPVRLCIVRELIKVEECNVSSMQHCLQLSQSVVSQHLARLKEHGIIRGRRKGVEVYYRVEHDEAAALVGALFGENT